jgi:tRNA uridine 5-carboxymethylaminomethyl modification enzyme
VLGARGHHAVRLVGALGGQVVDEDAGVGLVDDARWAAFERRRDTLQKERARLEGTMLSPTAATDDRLRAIGTTPLRKPTTLLELLRRPEVSYASLRGAFGGVDDEIIADRLEIRVKYAGYISRETEEAQRLRSLESLEVPEGFDYRNLAGLSREVKEKLDRVRPRSIGQASRIPGVTPAAVSILIVHLRSGRGHEALRTAG